MEVLLHPIAEKYLNRLSVTDRDRVDEAIEGLKEEPPRGNIRPVIGQPGIFRLTIGAYRALFRYKEDHIFVTHLDPRGQVYNKKNKGGKR